MCVVMCLCLYQFAGHMSHPSLPLTRADLGKPAHASEVVSFRPQALMAPQTLSTWAPKIAYSQSRSWGECKGASEGEPKKAEGNRHCLLTLRTHMDRTGIGEETDLEIQP